MDTGRGGTYASITEEHDQLCLKKPIPCPNTECRMSVERGRVEEHVESECVHTIVACQYSNIGCTKKEKRKDMKKMTKCISIYHLRKLLN